jgi:glycosyltransferase involved in cell wall biosynthesis
MVGPQPPPRHGVSVINEAVLAMARESGRPLRLFNTSPSSSSRNVLSRLSRLWPVARAIMGLNAALRENRNAVVYGSISGGFGILMELPIVRLARRRGARIVLHHHSFRYLDKKFAPMKWLARGAGASAVHVLLSSNMERAFIAQYPEAKRTLIVSNAAFIATTSPALLEGRGHCRVIGHLSNLCRDKGLFEIVELAEWAARENLDFEFRVAGPFADETTKREFHRRTQRLKNIQSLGPLDGESKRSFFMGLDAFVFPTQYRNEAEPLVLLEALSQGCPVISHDRGCIPSLIDSNCGALISRHEAFFPMASVTLRRWQAEANAHLSRRRAAWQKFAKLREGATRGEKKLLDILSGDDLTVNSGPSTIKTP